MIRDMSTKLTQKDVDLLLANPSAHVRSDTAKKVSEQYKTQTLSQTEKKIAEDIFRLITNDVEIQVRADLSDSLKNCSFLSHDIVEKIIKDVNCCYADDTIFRCADGKRLNRHC